MFQFPNMNIERLVSVKVSLLQVNQSQESIELSCDKKRRKVLDARHLAGPSSKLLTILKHPFF